MPAKIVVHSNTKRFFQVVAFAIVLAGALTFLQKVAEWRHNRVATPTSEHQPDFAKSNAPTSITSTESALVVGRSVVVDGDTLDIQGERIRLEGIDAVESSQLCGSEGQSWACGQQASAELRSWLGERIVSCSPKAHDRYQRVLARCFVESEDVQAWLVLNGWALAYRQYSTDYVAAERVAQMRKAGVWRGPFVPPWELRKR